VSGCCLLTTTLDTEAAAARLAATLVEERLAACVQVVGPVRSTWRWEGAVETAAEWLCVAKTTEAGAIAAAARIKSLHQYVLPELVITPITGGDPAYLDWIRRESTP